MNLDELTTELAAQRLRPAYLLAGDEALLRDDALAAIRGAVLGEAAEDWNLDRLNGQTATPAALRDAVGALPMMAAHRLVILRDPESRRGSSKALLEAIAEVVAEVSQQEQTVLVVASAKADKRARWVKAFADPAAVIDCVPPKGNRATTAFIKAEARRQGLKLERGAAELLGERIGPQLLLLRQEVAKVALLAGVGETLRVEHVEVSTGQVADEPIWDLTDAIGQGRRAEAISMLARMLAAGAPAPVVLGSLAAHFRKLLRISGGGRVPGPPFVVKKLESQARRYTHGRLISCLHAIHDADTALKGAGSLPSDMTLERLVLGLAV